jgi:hypothetical protein
MKVMTVSLTPDPRAGEGRFVSRIRDFHINPALHLDAPLAARP